MAITPPLTDRRNPLPTPVPTTHGDRQRTHSPPWRQPAARPRRRSGRTFGFWLGGFLLGVGGCILGAYMPYHDSVEVTISVLWWGLYFGSFGAWIGALLGIWAEPTLPPLPNPHSSGMVDARPRREDSNYSTARLELQQTGKTRRSRLT
jgi:hypothetical protein